MRKRAQAHDEDNDDLEYELDKAKRTAKNLQQQNDELVRKIKEYKAECESLKAEIENLKNKLG